MSVLSEMISNVKRWGVEVMFNRYYGIYPATVWNNSDPDGMGRVQVKSVIFGHVDNNGEVDKHYRWVLPAWPDMMYDPPEIGSEVWIQFISGNLDSPVYVGTRKIKGDSRFGEFQQKNIAPTIRAFKTKAGSKIVFYDESSNPRVEITAAGNTIVMDKAGVKINGSYIVTEKFLDFMNKHIADFGLGNLGVQVPLNPAGTAPEFVTGYLNKGDFKTDKVV